jgi:hypothetical protein
MQHSSQPLVLEPKVQQVSKLDGQEYESLKEAARNHFEGDLWLAAVLQWKPAYL